MPAVLDYASIDMAAAEIDEDEHRLCCRTDTALVGDEQRTSALVAERLDAAGLSVSARVGGYGVMAVLEGAIPGPMVGFGARAMLADGVFDRDVPREIYALHCAPLPAGMFAAGYLRGTFGDEPATTGGRQPENGHHTDLRLECLKFHRT